MLLAVLLMSATLSWTAPTENECGPATPLIPISDPGYCPPLDDLAGYNVYYGTESGVYPDTQLVNGLDTIHTVDSLSEQTWYFMVTAFDTSGNESDPSNEATKTGDVSAPGAPAIEYRTIDTKVYTVSKQDDAFLQTVVGTVPIGTLCDVAQRVNGRYAVPVAAVTFTGTVRDIVVVADCL